MDDNLPHHEQSIRAVGDHLPHHQPPMCAVGDDVLLEVKRVKESPEPTQRELVMRASQEAGLSNTVGLGQFFRTRPRCNVEGNWIALACNEFTKPRFIEGATVTKVLSRG